MVFPEVGFIPIQIWWLDNDVPTVKKSYKSKHVLDHNFHKNKPFVKRSRIWIFQANKFLTPANVLSPLGNNDSVLPTVIRCRRAVTPIKFDFSLRLYRCRYLFWGKFTPLVGSPTSENFLPTELFTGGVNRIWSKNVGDDMAV